MKRWLLFLAWLLFVGLVIAGADRGWRHPVYGMVHDLPGGDKLGHVVLVGVLAGLLNIATRGRRSRLGPFHFQRGGLIVAAVMSLEELSQLWIPGRTFDVGDLLANYLGILLAECARCWMRPPNDHANSSLTTWP